MGLFEFNIMPFGLCNSPATFQRMMDEVIGEDVGHDYLDDILTGSRTFEEHIEDLRKLFTTFRKNRFAMKLNKCKFFRKKLSSIDSTSSLDFLGYYLLFNES